MRTLWLLRHATAGAGDPGQPDHERPLTARGHDAARALGRHLAERGVAPDLVLCSTARRARETLEGVASAQRDDWVVLDERDVYLASEGELLQRLQRLPDDVRTALLVGHNPGIGELALRLATRGKTAALAELHRKVPTGALAELRLDGERWRDLPRGCELRSYVTPKHLPERS